MSAWFQNFYSKFSRPILGLFQGQPVGLTERAFTESYIYTVRDRDRDRQTDRQTDRDRDRQTDRQTDRDRDREKQRQTDRQNSMLPYVHGDHNFITDYTGRGTQDGHLDFHTAPDCMCSNRRATYYIRTIALLYAVLGLSSEVRNSVSH